MNWDDVISQCLHKQQEAFVMLLDRCEVSDVSLPSSANSAKAPLNFTQTIQRINFLSTEIDCDNFTSFCGVETDVNSPGNLKKKSSNPDPVQTEQKSLMIQKSPDNVMRGEVDDQKRYLSLLEKLKRGLEIGERQVSTVESAIIDIDTHTEGVHAKSLLSHLLPPRQHEPVEEVLDSSFRSNRSTMVSLSHDREEHLDFINMDALLEKFNFADENQMENYLELFETMICNAELFWRTSVSKSLLECNDGTALGPAPIDKGTARKDELPSEDTTTMRSLQNRVEQLSSELRNIGSFYENSLRCHNDLRLNTELSSNRMLEASRLSHISLSKLRDEIIFVTKDCNLVHSMIEGSRDLLEKVEVRLF